MTRIVERTCTAIRASSERGGSEPRSEPLSSFRSERAYVLLGDPGSGKTTAFRRERDALGDAAVLLDARDFLTLDPDQHPEWQGKTLFIDGLDEVRAGSSDVRTPLDGIRTRIDALRPLSVRISCREADWLGESDRSRLDAVAPGAAVATLRLDPLTPSDIEQILDSHAHVEDPHAFVERARERGVEALLSNPQTLNMLAEVVGTQADWPESRLETFEMACRQMATEHNEEHAMASPRLPLDRLLDAAGYLCAVQLVAGAAGYARRSAEERADFIALQDCVYPDESGLDHALGTKLFAGAGDGRLSPLHRHVAEFLGARYLAARIAAGLGARRVLALISGGDAAVVTEMRGLSGWLAAHSSEARHLLVTRDPLGTALYGDLGGFSTDERSKLLRALSRNETLGLLRREVSWLEAASALGALTAPDMEQVLVGILTSPSREAHDQQLVRFVLALLGQGPRRGDLLSALLRVVRDSSWPQDVNELALHAVLHVSEGADGSGDLVRLLEEIREGSIADRDYEMRGALLTRLYPDAVRPGAVWEHLAAGGNPDLGGSYLQPTGSYWLFWHHYLLNQSSDSDVVDLLDSLVERLPEARPAFESQRADSLPLQLLARGLAACGDQLATARLYNWLRSAVLSPWRRPDPEDESLLQVREWLQQRPDIQKSVILEGLSRCRDDDSFRRDVSEVWGALHRSERPSDFGLWCLEQAVALVPTHQRAGEELLEVAFFGHDQGAYAQGLSGELLADRVRGHDVLENHLSVLRERAAGRSAAAAREAAQISQAEDRGPHARDDGISYIRSHADELRGNRAPLALLRLLGHVYFLDGENWWKKPAPDERLLDRLGGDRDLADAALAGLRGTVWRSDVPGVDEIIRLRRASRMHYSALPYLAALEILEREAPEQLGDLTENQVRSALAFLYLSAPGFNGFPGWHAVFTNRSPRVVADVAARCLETAVRHGNGYSPALDAINLIQPPELAHETALGVLRRFPARASLEKLDTLDRLLWRALGYPDRSSLLDLIAEKLPLRSMNVGQRVRWLAAGVVAAPESYTHRLDEYVRGRERRARSLGTFFGSGDAGARLPRPSYQECAPAIGALIALMGRSFAPIEATEWSTSDAASEMVDQLIRRLSALPGDDATEALSVLVSDPDLTRWRARLGRARDDQRVLHRDAAYRHPSLAELHRALADGPPANPADLAALLLDRLADIASGVRTANTDDWRQYWNEDPYGRAANPKHEDSCRDALLSQLRTRLPEGVEAQPEGQYAGDRRSDIRVASVGVNVPVEIKKDSHRDVWNALRSQLIDQYTGDIEASGFGIYLVFWFGRGDVQPPPHGVRPTTPAELERRLEESLTADESGKISVIAIDVSPVGADTRT